MDFRSHRSVSFSEGSSPDLCWIVTVKTPPVVGTKATSPSEVLKVERSSCPNCIKSDIDGLVYGEGRSKESRRTLVPDVDGHLS